MNTVKLKEAKNTGECLFDLRKGNGILNQIVMKGTIEVIVYLGADTLK